MSRQKYLGPLVGLAIALQGIVAASAAERCANYSGMRPGAFKNPLETPVKGGLIITYAFGGKGAQIVRQGSATGISADRIVMYFMKEHSTAYVSKTGRTQYVAYSDADKSELSVTDLGGPIADFHLKDSPTHAPLSFNVAVADPFIAYGMAGDGKLLQKVCFNTVGTLKVTSNAMLAMLRRLM